MKLLLSLIAIVLFSTASSAAEFFESHQTADDLIQSQQAKRKVLNRQHQSFYQNYEENLHDFHREIMISLELRQQSTKFFEKEMLEGNEQYFDSQDITNIQKAVEAYARNNDVLLEQIAYYYRDLIEDIDLVLVIAKSK